MAPWAQFGPMQPMVLCDAWLLCCKTCWSLQVLQGMIICASQGPRGSDPCGLLNMQLPGCMIVDQGRCGALLSFSLLRHMYRVDERTPCECGSGTQLCTPGAQGVIVFDKQETQVLSSCDCDRLPVRDGGWSGLHVYIRMLRESNRVMKLWVFMDFQRVS
jgi:hypothetical protein